MNEDTKRLGEILAFPATQPLEDMQGGMNLRQYYAGMTMQGLLASGVATGKLADDAWMAPYAVSQADSLLVELVKPEAKP